MIQQVIPVGKKLLIKQKKAEHFIKIQISLYLKQHKK
jgi:hypothetical protein